jgi:hypothetical protein
MTLRAVNNYELWFVERFRPMCRPFARLGTLYDDLGISL